MSKLTHNCKCIEMPYQRHEIKYIIERLSEFPRFLIIVAGPRQVGKTTLVRQALSGYPKERASFIPVDRPDAPFISLGLPTESDFIVSPGGQRDVPWLVWQWQRAREAARKNPDGHILVLDEIQKIPRWSEAVKGLWDEDRAEELKLHVVLLGSSPLLMQKGMTESLTGRYELIRVTHWSFPEMYEAFGFNLDEYVYFGGYPGAAEFVKNEPRWRDYVRDGLVEPSIAKDVLMMARVDKPALLRQLFNLGCNYSGQLLSYTKMLGQLQDAGNTVTLAHYLDLLGNAGLIQGLQKYAGQQMRRRASVPKLNVLNTALMSARSGYSKMEAKADRSFWGRLVESAVGAHLYNTGHPECSLYYWREGSHEVDYVIEYGMRRAAIEVKSGEAKAHVSGLDRFEDAFGKCKKILVGEGGIPLAEFLSHPAEYWL